MMRPLVMDFSTDEGKALQQKYEYMFGPAFLVFLSWMRSYLGSDLCAANAGRLV